MVDAVTGIADKIKSIIGFSLPEDGPMADEDEYMPDFMELMAQGLENSRGMIQKAMDDVASDMSISPTASVNAVNSGSASGSNDLSGVLSSLLSGIREIVESSDSQRSSTITIPIYLGNALLDEVILDAQQRQSLRSGGR
ncbi:MAG: hypothetical protein LUB63_04405 [Oscillospiraceae bacterium]|nr:hypothetical protein [Oscillospiraceae bacterium]